MMKLYRKFQKGTLKKKKKRESIIVIHLRKVSILNLDSHITNLMLISYTNLFLQKIIN